MDQEHAFVAEVKVVVIRTTVPAALSAALNANPRAKAAWEALTPSRRHEILTQFNFLNTPAALERNVRSVIADLLKSENRAD